MSHRNTLSLIFIIGSLLCLYPGLTLPMMNIRAGTTLPLIGTLILFDETQSIVQTITTLIDNDNYLVAILIFSFSILVPIFKAVILIFVLTLKSLEWRRSLHKFVAIIGKWSMADVFVVGIFIAFLTTKSNPNINATLHPGFYYFSAYCVISIIGIQLMSLDSEQIRSQANKSQS